MFKSPTVLLMVLGGTVGVPYAATHVSSWADGRGDDAPALLDDLSATGPSATGPSATGPAAHGLAHQQNMAQYQTAAGRIAAVLRLDATPEWVYQQWDRKSTKLADLDRHGVRVPLVTGTELSDLAGSLTYYFNAEGQMQQISLRGRTGDPRPLIAFVTTQHRFRAQPAQIPGEYLYQTRWNGRPQSELRLRAAPVLSATTPHDNYEVHLDLTHPSSGLYLDTPRRQGVPVPTRPNPPVSEEPQPKPESPTYSVRSGAAHSGMNFQPRQVIKKKPG